MKTKGGEKEREKTEHDKKKKIECLGLGRNKVFKSQEFENIISSH